MRMDIRLHFIGLLFLLIELVTFADLAVSVEGYVGGDVVLPCSDSGPDASVTLPDKDITFDWHFKDGTNIIMVDEGKIKFGKQFENRVTLFAPERGNFSVKLTNLNENDSGKYTCSIAGDVGPDLQIQDVVLTIKEKTTPEPKKNPGNSSMMMGPQKSLFFLISVLMMIMSV